jgi:hypothetical protein
LPQQILLIATVVGIEDNPFAGFLPVVADVEETAIGIQQFLLR